MSTAEVRNGDFDVYIEGLGVVQPFQTVRVRSRVDGEITRINFKQGQMVNAGDILAQIDPRPYQAALDQAKAKKAQDEANLANASAILQRYQNLAKQDFASREQLETQQALVKQLQAQIEGDQASIDNAQTQLDYTTIHSPLTGKASFRQVDRGNIVRSGDSASIVSVVSVQPISVVFTAPEGYIGTISKAFAGGAVPVDAFSSDGQTLLAHGRLAVIDNAIAETSGAISMKASFTNEDNALWPGLSVTTRMRVAIDKNVVIVPQDAVLHGPNGLYAYVVGVDRKVRQQALTVAASGHGEAVIASGLKAGETVVVTGQYRLVAGTLVDPKPKIAASSDAQTAHVVATAER